MIQDDATQKIYEELKRTIRTAVPESVVPDFELQRKAELVKEIRELKKQKNAVILGHNYMEPVLFYSIPDFRGDSLALSKKAAETDADIIVFCGVGFMAETAKILNPTKKVLIPSQKAGCSLAEGIKAEDVRWIKSRFPGLPVVTYINTYADVKAETDYCCTSGNATKVVETACKEFGTKSVIFLPDKYMAQNIANETGRKTFYPDRTKPEQELPDYKNDAYIIGWNARCYVHEQYTVEHIKDIRNTYPDVEILAHPECPPDVVKASDYSGSTSGMVEYVEKHGANKRIALLTECSMADNIVATHPEVNDNLIRMCNLRCKYMNTITLEQTRDALKYEQYEVNVPDDIRERALLSVQRMIKIG